MIWLNSKKTYMPHHLKQLEEMREINVITLQDSTPIGKVAISTANTVMQKVYLTSFEVVW